MTTDQRQQQARRSADYNARLRDNIRRHRHDACTACFHKYAHGMWEGYSLAVNALVKAGHVDVADELERKQSQTVNRFARKVATLHGIDSEELAALMQHHGARK